jgi:hypothetical protein
MDVLSHCRIGGSRGNIGERRVVDRVLVGKPEGRDHLEDQGISGDNIKMDLLAI